METTVKRTEEEGNINKKQPYRIAVRIVRIYNLSGEILLLAKALSHSQHMITLKHT